MRKDCFSAQRCSHRVSSMEDPFDGVDLAVLAYLPGSSSSSASGSLLGRFAGVLLAHYARRPLRYRTRSGEERIRRVRDHLYIHDVCVDSELRGMGVASRMFESLFRKAGDSLPMRLNVARPRLDPMSGRPLSPADEVLAERFPLLIGMYESKGFVVDSTQTEADVVSLTRHRRRTSGTRKK